MFQRQWVHFNSITTISASKKIVQNHYGKTVRFTRAVDELNIIRDGAMAQIQQQTQRQTQQQSQQQTQQQTRVLKPILKRLTEQEINDALRGDLSHWGIETQSQANTENEENTKRKAKGVTPEKEKKKMKNVPVVKKYNLRKR